MDHLVTRRDPLGATETIEYDRRGNIVRYVDRKQQITTFDYDALNRPTDARFADGVSVGVTRDAGGRIVQIRDTTGGIVFEEYDLPDRLTARTTDLGTIRYRYDPVDRRTQMDVPGQAPVVYHYDAGARLLRIGKGSDKGSMSVLRCGYGGDAAPVPAGVVAVRADRMAGLKP